jgi:hypothetical protein
MNLKQFLETETLPINLKQFLEAETKANPLEDIAAATSESELKKLLNANKGADQTFILALLIRSGEVKKKAKASTAEELLKKATDAMARGPK